jgi:hypothetical protein
VIVGAMTGTARTPGWTAVFPSVTAVLYVVLNVGLVGLHADEDYFPRSTTAWVDPAGHDHHGHNHAACVVFWSSAPSVVGPPVPPEVFAAVVPSPILHPEEGPPRSAWRKQPPPRSPPPEAR